MTRARTVLAVDPGSSKIGMALVRRENDGSLEVLWRRIGKIEELENDLREGMAIENPATVVVGSGTNSKAVVRRIRELGPVSGILLVDEANTSQQARERYWEHHPRRGWRRILPASLQTPPEPVDDFVAVILAERVLGDD